MVFNKVLKELNKYICVFFKFRLVERYIVYKWLKGVNVKKVRGSWRVVEEIVC